MKIDFKALVAAAKATHNRAASFPVGAPASEQAAFILEHEINPALGNAANALRADGQNSEARRGQSGHFDSVEFVVWGPTPSSQGGAAIKFAFTFSQGALGIQIEVTDAIGNVNYRQLLPIDRLEAEFGNAFIKLLDLHYGSIS